MRAKAGKTEVPDSWWETYTLRLLETDRHWGGKWTLRIPATVHRHVFMPQTCEFDSCPVGLT